MKKLFVSLPMSGREEKEVLARMDELKAIAEKRNGEQYELIQTYFKEFTATSKYPCIEYLGDSIRLMADADFIFFDKRWSQARGCRVEMAVAKAYDMSFDIENSKIHKLVTVSNETIHVDKEFRDTPVSISFFPVKVITCIKKYNNSRGKENNTQGGMMKLEMIHGLNLEEFFKVKSCGQVTIDNLLSGCEVINNKIGKTVIKLV